MENIVLKPSEHRVTPIDEKKKAVSEILKRVDQLIKKNDLDRALIELAHAKEYDPRNVYALALEERIALLKEEQKQYHNSVEKHDLLQTQVRESNESSIINNENDHCNKTSLGGQEAHPTQQELQKYFGFLIESLRQGHENPELERHLSEMRKQYKISDNLHQTVRQEALKYMVEHHPKNTNLSTSQPNSKVQKQRDKILIIDDDPKLLELLTQSLMDHGYEVIALATSDEAYALLRKFTPDLILCDINLETSTMGGFTFYEKIQEFHHLHHVPFIFLTGLTDAAIVRTGKEIGVDDYLTKPITEDALLATIRGKLKRFKQLRTFFSQKPAVSMATP
ncbi:MAG: response regulator [Bacteroidetes bacterium]|nr:response regulator [Bacteroidota bacterium]